MKCKQYVRGRHEFDIEAYYVLANMRFLCSEMELNILWKYLSQFQGLCLIAVSEEMA